MAAGTFCIALSIGFFMQNGDAVANLLTADDAQAQSDPVATAGRQTDEIGIILSDDTSPAMARESAAGMIPPQMPGSTMSKDVLGVIPGVGTMPGESVQLAALDPKEMPPMLAKSDTSPETICTPDMTASPAPAANIGLKIIAPCHVSQAFTIHHQGMMFTAVTDGDGRADLLVPTLAEVAVVIAAFADGQGALVTATVPDFTSYDRAVLQWQGDNSVTLSAYEGAALFGEPSHIHAGNPGDAARLDAAQGGHLVRLGDPSIDGALKAEVYTFPTKMIDEPFDVRLVAEAEITSANCGGELSAQSIQVSTAGQTSALDLTMVMPNCDAVGDFLILQNMFKDLKLATK